MSLPAWPHQLSAAPYQDLAATYANVEQVEQRRRSASTSPADLPWLDATSVDLSRYLIVRSAGFLEATRDASALDYVRRKSPDKIYSYVRAGIGKGQGAAVGQLKGFLNSFDPTLGSKLDNLLGQNIQNIPTLESKISALINSRKQLAHGLNDNVVATASLTRCEASIIVASHIVYAFQNA